MKNFGQVPSVRYNRSKFDLSHGVKTTMSVGKLYPIKCLEVLPGDSFKSVMTAVARCTTAFLKPIIDNLYIDVHHFFVPYRLLYDNSEKVFGNPNPSQYTNPSLDEYPSLPVSLISSGTVGDYLGLPVSLGTSGKTYTKKGCSVLPFRAFAKIYNDWFRNENTVDEMLIQTGAYSSSEAPNNNAWAPNNYTGQLPYVGKKKDYFTSGLPQTQKGLGVGVPLTGLVPVNTFSSSTPRTVSIGSYENAMRYRLALNSAGATFPASTTYPVNIAGSSSASQSISAVRGSSSSGSASQSNIIVPDNLWANMTGSGVDISVSDLRTSFQLQKMLEKDARYGSRYNEFLLGHFGVSSPDARLQFSEYLGGGRIPIGIQQVSQTAPLTTYTEDGSELQTTPLGAVGANSQSVGRSRYSKGFVEHGYVMTVACIRQLHTYQQGIPRLFFRKKREDFYDPLLANISEQPVYKAQLYGYASGSSDTTELTDDVFNYNEAWADYRYEPSMITGQLRSGLPNSLDIWHLADYYNSAPTFGQAFTDETSQFIDRVLAVPTASQDNFLLDIWFNVSAIRVMPVYSVPGLVDHH